MILIAPQDDIFGSDVTGKTDGIAGRGARIENGIMAVSPAENINIVAGPSVQVIVARFPVQCVVAGLTEKNVVLAPAFSVSLPNPPCKPSSPLPPDKASSPS